MKTVEELQAELDKANSESAKRIKELSDEAAAKRIELKKYEGIDPDKYKEMSEMTEKQRQAEEKKQGNWEKLQKERDDLYAAEIKKRDESEALLKARFEKVVIDNAIIGAAGNAINQNQVLALIKSEHKLTVDGDNVSVFKDEKPVLDKSGHPIKISELVAGYLGANPHLVKSSGSGTGDTGGDKSKSQAGGDRLTNGLKAMLA